MMKKLIKSIDDLTASSSSIKSPKQVIELVAGQFCNNYFNESLWKSRKPAYLVSVSKNLATDFTSYSKQDLEKLHDICYQVEQLFIKASPFEDVFNNLIAPYCGKDKSLGQFFTPKSMAEVLTAFVPIEYVKGQPVNVADSTGCGVGNLILSQMKRFYESHGEDALPDLHVLGLDLDLSLVKIAITQVMTHCIVHGLNIGSVVFHCGNAITGYNEDTEVFSFKFVFSQPNLVALFQSELLKRSPSTE